ncbi:MAG: DUF1569 domain-containing protein [Fibrobacterales bacterium]
MISILNSKDNTALLKRFCNLTPTSTAQWGTLTVDRMIPHLNDQMRVATGDVKAEDKSNIFLRTIMKSLTLSWGLPVPKGKIKTDRTMLLSEPTTLDEDMQKFHLLLERVIEKESTASHPAFGVLTHKEWCILVAIHIDHHLKQFGC